MRAITAGPKKQVEEWIIQEGRIKHTIPKFTTYSTDGFQEKIPRKVHINTTSKIEKEILKNIHKILVEKQLQEQEEGEFKI